MCAGGIPTYREDHVCNMVKAGLDMLGFIDQYNKKRIEKGFDVWDIRIGIHVGPLVAGVVGRNKYAYDIWGSTVNIASRMESSGFPGMINISAVTYDLIKNDFNCDYRGKIYAKNVGEIDMYFVTNAITPRVKKDLVPDI
jgi:adenylate cyclase